MNTIIIVVAVVVAFLLAIVLFSLDDQDDEADFLDLQDESESSNSSSESPKIQKVQKTDKKLESNDNNESEQEKLVEKKVSENKIALIKSSEEEPLPTTGTEEDLRFRIILDQKLSPAQSSEKINTVALALQLRFPDENFEDEKTLIKQLQAAENVLERDFSSEFSCYPLSQLTRLLLFSSTRESDDPMFDALVVAFEIITCYKKAIENSDFLRESKLKASVGIAMGEVIKIERGLAAEPTWYGKACLMAETLAESAGDFSIYVDEQVHKAALPLADFREWKPIKLRASMPRVKLFELVGWNKPEEIASFVRHEDKQARRSVAIAYRYMDLDDRLQSLMELISDTEEEVALAALETLKEIGSEQSLGLLKRIFPETPDPEFRSAIIDVFATIGNKTVVPLILASTKEANWKVRLSAAKALYKLSQKDSLKHLEHLLGDSDGGVRAAVNSIFYTLTKKTEYYDNLVGLLVDLSQRARKIAVEELLSFESEVAIKAVVASFGEQETEIQKQILRKLEFTQSKILYQSYLKLFRQSGEPIRKLIVNSVRRAGLVS